MRPSQIRFIRQQGVTREDIDLALYEALMFQPRAVGVVFLIAVVFQSPWVFVALAVLLGWAATGPASNPFDVVYQRLTAYPRGLGQLAPRRFAAGLAGTLALGIAVLLLAGSTIAAWAIELFFAVAVVAVAFTDFCPGAALYHRLVALKRTA